MANVSGVCVDADGIVRNLGLHDSVILGVQLKDETLRIYLRRPNGSCCDLIFSEVHQACFDSFWEQNVVFDVMIYPLSSAPLDEIKQLIHHDGDENVRKFLSHPLEERMIVRVSSSVGMSGIASFKNASYQIDGQEELQLVLK